MGAACTGRAVLPRDLTRIATPYVGTEPAPAHRGHVRAAGGIVGKGALSRTVPKRIAPRSVIAGREEIGMPGGLVRGEDVFGGRGPGIAGGARFTPSPATRDLVVVSRI